jgi:hypothetical protein
MRCHLFVLLAFILGTTACFAQHCTVREEFNPATDSLDWVVGHKDWAEFYVGKSEPRPVLLKIAEMVLVPHQTTDQDSVWLFLDDGHVIKGANARAAPSRHEKYWAIFTEIEFDFIELYLPIGAEDLRRLAQSKVTKVRMRFYTPNPEQQKNFARKLRKGLTKSSPVAIVQDYVEVTHHKVRKRWKNFVVKAAGMAAEYAQEPGDSRMQAAVSSSENP